MLIFLINIFNTRKKLLELENSSAIADIGSESSSNEDDVIEICEDFDELKNEGVLVSRFYTILCMHVFYVALEIMGKGESSIFILKNNIDCLMKTKSVKYESVFYIL